MIQRGNKSRIRTPCRFIASYCKKTLWIVQPSLCSLLVALLEKCLLFQINDASSRRDRVLGLSKQHFQPISCARIQYFSPNQDMEQNKTENLRSRYKLFTLNQEMSHTRTQETTVQNFNTKTITHWISVTMALVATIANIILSWANVWLKICFSNKLQCFLTNFSNINIDIRR